MSNLKLNRLYPALQKMMMNKDIETRYKKIILILFFFSFFNVYAEDMFIAPKKIWKTHCYPCLPLEKVFDNIEENVVVEMRNPCYENGVISTDQGGILTAPYFHVQSQKVVYTKKCVQDTQIMTLECEGNILIDYQQWVLAGDYLYYDFITNSGFLRRGRTAKPPWYAHGEEILLLKSGDLVAINGFITTSEETNPDVVFRSQRIVLTPQKVVSADNVNFWVKKLPFFWFPKMKIDLDNNGHSPFAVKFGWGGFLGSHLSLLYNFLSWGELKGIARLDGFFGHGLGGGIETRYNPKFKTTECYTRSYYAHDISIDDPNKRDRYRLQGTFYDCIKGISVNGMYDYVSDAQMAADFYIHDFEIPTAGRTQLELKKRETSWIANLFTTVRVNDFQSINQELPTFAFTVHPFEIANTGIILENTFQASYLSYVFSDDVKNATDFHSGRIFTHPYMYRPTQLGPVTVTPECGFIGIAYTNTPHDNFVGQALGEIGCRAHTSIYKNFCNHKHVFAPYLKYNYLTEPRVATGDHYIFTINDGYDYLNVLRFGCENSLFYRTESCVERPFWFDLWGNGFFNEKTIPKLIPKIYLQTIWKPYHRFLVGTEGGWNFEKGLLDYYNARVGWTVSNYVAFGFEYRHRSSFDWRKADFYNFILESVRSQDALLASPLSDRRDTFLFNTFIRLTPDWTIKLELRRGWNRISQPCYLEYQATLNTILFNHWKLQFIYDKREADHRYAFSLKLNPGPPPKKSACL